eukprot:scaffold49030_cov67-Phaeocystis_antarctica.AAC.1
MLEPGGWLPRAMSGFSALGWIEVGPQPSPPPCSAVIAPKPCRPDPTAAAAAAAPWALCGRSGGVLSAARCRWLGLRAEREDRAGCGPGGLDLLAPAASWLPSLSCASTARVCCCASASCEGVGGG